jgi:AmmeMemoRadiSam system protein B
MSFSHVRPPAVAGMFYPDEPEELKSMLSELLKQEVPSDRASAKAPKVLLVPHAGYIYSGRTAARAYASLIPFAAQIQRVVVLGPCHRAAVQGIALPASEAFLTPLGSVRIDQDAIAAIRALPGVCVHPNAHALEHSLEVQLPFLQTVLGDFSLVPLAVGDADIATVSQVIEILWGGPETLFVVSSDLSHYHVYTDANAIDTETIKEILALCAEIVPEQACGAFPLNGMLHVAAQRHLKPRLIERCNSGDTAGDKSRVVGYCSIAFDEDIDRAKH